MPLPRLFFIVALGLFLSAPARAQNFPDYFSLGLGAYDFDKGQARRQSVDYRLEYEWGVSLSPFDFMQLHPTLGFEGNSKGAVFGNGGLNLDVPFLSHGIFTWGEAVGAFGSGGDARQLGSILEFRSQLELGWQFDNALRVTSYISHISNSATVSDNPGAEIAGFYVHVPMSLLESK